MCGPMRGAIIGAMLFERWATNVDEAARLASSGGIIGEEYATGRPEFWRGSSGGVSFIRVAGYWFAASMGRLYKKMKRSRISGPLNAGGR